MWQCHTHSTLIQGSSGRAWKFSGCEFKCNLTSFAASSFSSIEALDTEISRCMPPDHLTELFQRIMAGSSTGSSGRRNLFSRWTRISQAITSSIWRATCTPSLRRWNLLRPRKPPSCDAKPAARRVVPALLPWGADQARMWRFVAAGRPGPLRTSWRDSRGRRTPHPRQ